MMLVNLKLPDELFEAYVNKWGVVAAYSKMKTAIDAYKEVDKNDRVLLVAGDTRRALEAVFQTTLDSPDKLLKLVQNLVRVKVGDVQMDFSADQLERLASQASFHGRTLETYMRETVQELQQTMLERV